MPGAASRTGSSWLDQKRNKKISRLWVLARALGMSGELLHLSVESITGKKSIRTLTLGELDRTINILASRAEKEKRKPRREKTAGVAYLPTRLQRDLVDDLLSKITIKLDIKNPDAYLLSICRKTFKKDYSLLNRTQMQRLIEALKSIQNREPEDK
jgi:phage gp16-like protein